MIELKEFAIEGPEHNAVLVLPSKDHISTYITKYHKYYEIDLLKAIKSLDLRGVYIDIGAHYGNHTTFFAKECPSTEVISIDASPQNFSGLLKTIEANDIGDKVLPFNVAIHNTWTTVDSFYKFDTNSGSAAVCEDVNGQIEATRLDDLLGDIDDVAVIKIDTQFVDKSVVESALDIIKRCHPLLAIESCTKEEVEGLEEILIPLGYCRSKRYCASPTYIWRVLDRG